MECTKQFAIWLCMCFSTLSLANESHQRVKLTAGLPDFAPFSLSQEKSGRLGAVELYLMQLANQAGVDIEVLHMPYARVLAAIEDGTLDIAVLFFNDNLADSARFVSEVSRSKVLVLPRTNIRLEKFEDLHRLERIAVIRGAKFLKRFDIDKAIRKLDVNDYAQALNMLMLGRVDAVIGSETGLVFNSQRLNKTLSDWGTPMHLTDRQWWLHMSNKSAHLNLIPKLTEAVNDLYSPYLIDRIYAEKVSDQTFISQ